MPHASCKQKSEAGTTKYSDFSQPLDGQLPHKKYYPAAQREQSSNIQLVLCQQPHHLCSSSNFMAVNNTRNRNNPRNHSHIAPNRSPQNDNDNIGTTPAMTSSSSPHSNFRNPRQPPPLFRSLQLTGWEIKKNRSWFTLIQLGALESVRDGGYDTNITWKRHSVHQQSQAVLHFKAYIREKTGYFCTSFMF